jgi:hypothetical protein
MQLGRRATEMQKPRGGFEGAELFECRSLQHGFDFLIETIITFK